MNRQQRRRKASMRRAHADRVENTRGVRLIYNPAPAFAADVERRSAAAEGRVVIEPMSMGSIIHSIYGQWFEQQRRDVEEFADAFGHYAHGGHEVVEGEVIEPVEGAGPPWMQQMFEHQRVLQHARQLEAAPRCRNGLDDLHEEIQSMPAWSPERLAAKERLFACHYSADGCGWRP